MPVESLRKDYSIFLNSSAKVDTSLLLLLASILLVTLHVNWR